MNNYMYFINLDDQVIKFGVSSSICSRLNTHHDKFVKYLGLKNQLDIINIIGFKNKILNKEVENRLKNQSGLMIVI